MEPVNFSNALKILGDFGVLGLVIFLWWSDNKRIWMVLDQYKQDMTEQRKMYDNNVTLTHTVCSIAEDLRNIVTLNIQKMTETADAVRQNQFCPLIRVDSAKIVNWPMIKKENEKGQS